MQWLTQVISQPTCSCGFFAKETFFEEKVPVVVKDDGTGSADADVEPQEIAVLAIVVVLEAASEKVAWPAVAV